MSSVIRPFFQLLLLVLIIIVGVYLWILHATTNNTAAPPSAGLAGALRQPQKVVNERIELKEGQFVSYSLNLSTDARVQVKINAVPKYVDVMLMTKEEADKFRQISGDLFGGRYTYRQALSSKQILQMDKTEVLPRGDWVIIVRRPSESLLLHKETAANISITVY